jgi:hypothetical protein
MRGILVIALVLALGALAAAEGTDANTSFKAWDVRAETGEETLGAYQIGISYPKATREASRKRSGTLPITTPRD